MSDHAGVPPEFFDRAYDAAPPPWDTGRPQGDLVRLAERDAIKGKVLDIGCGTGENALYFAERGLEVLGIDRVPAAIDRARAKAAARGSSAKFEVADALQLGKLRKKFDTLVDSGLFHVLSDADRQAYARSVASAVKGQGALHILCFSDAEPGTDGPRRVAERELIDLFNMRGWLVEEIAEARFDSLLHPDGARAWLATFTRLR